MLDAADRLGDEMVEQWQFEYCIGDRKFPCLKLSTVLYIAYLYVHVLAQS
jgi:hypothetical protein